MPPASRLAPGAEAQHRQDLEACREAERIGAGRGASVAGPPDCKPLLRFADKVYGIDRVPALPLPGCTRQPFCLCRYTPALK